MAEAKKTAAVVTVSDSASQGRREDKSGPAVAEALRKLGYEVLASEVVPDSQPEIEAALLRLCDFTPLVVTTGGTGIAARDVTPEATRAVADRVVDGVGELMRASGLHHTPMAVLSRAVAATRGRSLILNLPGSPKGAIESLEAVAHLIPHMIGLLSGDTEH